MVRLRCNKYIVSSISSCNKSPACICNISKENVKQSSVKKKPEEYPRELKIVWKRVIYSGTKGVVIKIR